MHKIVLSPCLILLQEIWLETQDAELLHEGEEVTLMDWGNAIIKVEHLSYQQKFASYFIANLHHRFATSVEWHI